MTPYAIAASGPAPTIDIEESSELVDGMSGTLTAADASGVVTFVDLPTLRTTRFDVDGEPVCVSGPDEGGRIAYVVRYVPWHQQALNFLLGIGRERAALRVRCSKGGPATVLREMSEHASRAVEVQLSRRGGRVLLFRPPRELWVFDLERGELFHRRVEDQVVRSPWLDDDGAHLNYERRPRLEPGVVPADLDVARWFSVRVDLASGEVQETWDNGASALRGPLGRRWVARPYRPADEARSNSPPGSLGMTSLDFDDGRTIYAGLARRDARARSFLSFTAPDFEHSLRLGEQHSARTRTLVPRFQLGAWTFTDVRLEP